MRAFAEVLRAEGCTGVLVQDYEHARFDALALLTAALRLPLYASFQGGDVTLSRLEARVRGRTLRRCRGLAVASARERARLARTYGLGATVQDIPNPVDAAYWRAEPRAVARVELGVPADEVLFFNHGRIDIHRKGLDVLVEAWREVARRSRARLVIVGSGQDRDQFQVLLQGASGVTWIPDYVTDPPLIRRWLSAADIYVTLSRIEGMPVAPLEAMACGLPVIAADAHGLIDLAAEGGVVLVPREQAESAAEAMLQLAADPSLRQRLGRAARATIEARYSIPTVGARLSMLARTERASGRPWPPRSR